MTTTERRVEWCVLCDRYLEQHHFSKFQWYKRSLDKKCLSCTGTPADPRISKHEPRQCITCEEFKGYKEFTDRRWEGRDGAELICKACTPKRVSRLYIPGAIYPCVECKQGLPGTSFRPRTKTGPNSKYLAGMCKKCEEFKNKARHYKDSGLDEEQVRQRIDARYDYAFARDILGWGHEKIVAWLVHGYPALEYKEITSLALLGPSLAPPPWEPDPLPTPVRLLEIARDRAA